MMCDFFYFRTKKNVLIPVKMEKMDEGEKGVENGEVIMIVLYLT